MKKKSIKEIRKELHKFQNRLRKFEGKNKLTEKYLIKLRYMMMWLRLIPINKKILDNWHMPDMGDIYKMEKEKK